MSNNNPVIGENKEPEEKKVPDIEAFKHFIRENLKDNLELADKIMERMEVFVPTEELILGIKTTPKGLATYINPSFSTMHINNAFCVLDDALRAERYVRKVAAAEKNKQIIKATPQDKHHILNFPRFGKRRR